MRENKHTMSDLYQMQSLPLDAKIRMTEYRINEWVDEYGEDGVYVSFSGGKDSTVLLDIVRNRLGYKDIPAVFVDVPTQYPELREFAKTWDNLVILKPKISFMEVCRTYGFPLISKEVANNVEGARKYIKILTDRQTDSQTDRQTDRSAVAFHIPTTTEEYVELVNMINNDWGKVQGSPQRLATILGIRQDCGKANIPSEKDRSMFSMVKYKFLLESKFAISDKCCNVMKKKPAHDYEKETKRKPIVGTMAEESQLRTQKWLQNGCNAFDGKYPKSQPLSFWTEQDVLAYIKQYHIPICSVYGDIVVDYEAQGQLEGQMRFDDLDMTRFGVFDLERPMLKTTGCKRTGCMLCGFGCHLEQSPNRFEMLKETHPKMYALMDVCENNGVTFRQAIDWINEHGNMNIKY